MTEFQRQFKEVEELLQFEEYNQVTKRVIDFTLDTENIECYTKTNQYLNWLDINEKNDLGKKEKLQRTKITKALLFFKNLAIPSIKNIRHTYKS